MKKNGFTLVELMVTIAIILMITLLITPKVNQIVDDSRKKGYKEIEKRMEEAALKYLHEEYVDSSLTEFTLTKQDLINNKYIDEIYDLKDKTVCDGNVVITELNSNYPNIKVHLICSNYIS